MKKLLRSKTIAWLAFALVIVLIVVTFSRRTQWWAFIDIFFAFMSVFCHVISLTLEKLNSYAAKKLDIISFYLFILFILAFIGEFIAFSI